MKALKRVLLVEDRADLAQGLASMLRRKSGVEVQVRSDAGRALMAILLGDFDAIVTDFNMPGMDGLEMATRVRDVLNLDVPVAIFTQQRRQELRNLENLDEVHYIHKSDLRGLVSWVDACGARVHQKRISSPTKATAFRGVRRNRDYRGHGEPTSPRTPRTESAATSNRRPLVP